MLPNLITLARIPLLACIVGLLYQEQSLPRLVAAGLIVLLILLDTVDGLVARATAQTSILGSILDIAADRSVELVLWVAFADLDLVPIIFPLFVITRGVFVDALRAIAPARGLAPFDLVQSSLGRFLVKSPWLRTPYGIVKAVAFCLLALQHGLTDYPSQAPRTWIGRIAVGATWLAVAMCLVRGLPVLIEGPRILSKSPPA